ncbi:hypothetical protein [Nonomuraea dietziae]|uniref:hypothetical protein n=1 Tax=Nonomuraea dietziae TaxID=65515 RepID=UPI003373E5F9
MGSVEVGKLADLVLWDPAFFGVKPTLVLKGGVVAWAQMGDSQRLHPHAATGHAQADVRRVAASPPPPPRSTSSPPSRWSRASPDRLDVRRRLAPVADVRRRGKEAMPLNDALPRIEIAPDTFEVRVDGS